MFGQTLFQIILWNEKNSSKLRLLLNPFHAIALFLYSLKTPGNKRFSDVFRGYRKRPVALNRLKCFELLLMVAMHSWNGYIFRIVWELMKNKRMFYWKSLRNFQVTSTNNSLSAKCNFPLEIGTRLLRLEKVIRRWHSRCQLFGKYFKDIATAFAVTRV